MKYAVFLSLLLFVLTSCVGNIGTEQGWYSDIVSGEKYQQRLTDEERIEMIRERRKELDSIRKWDFFVTRNNPDEALAYYLQVAEKLPNDVILQKKIWHAYYAKKDWTNAYAAYIRTPIWELSDSEKVELLSALFFDESQLDRMGEVSKIELWTGEVDIYSTVSICYSGIHNCIVHIESYSGSTPTMQMLQSSIRDAQKITPDYQYRNFVVATKFYELWHYRAASIIAREILQNRPDYTGVEKLLWFSLFEIGNYTDAKKFLLSQLEKYPKDLETIVRLGDVFFRQSDYATANLYFNNAIIAGYTHKTDIERKLAYSYAQLRDVPAMMKVLAYLLEEPDATDDDAAVAISLALQNGENLKAYVWASNAIKKYPQSAKINALYLTTLRASWKFKEAQDHIYTLSDTMLYEPVILLEKAIILLEHQWDLASARMMFESVRDIDPTADFALEAENYIQFIENKLLITDTEDADDWGIVETWWR